MEPSRSARIEDGAACAEAATLLAALDRHPDHQLGDPEAAGALLFRLIQSCWDATPFDRAQEGDLAAVFR
jgi:hypothetical protein